MLALQGNVLENVFLEIWISAGLCVRLVILIVCILFSASVIDVGRTPSDNNIDSYGAPAAQPIGNSAPASNSYSSASAPAPDSYGSPAPAPRAPAPAPDNYGSPAPPPPAPAPAPRAPQASYGAGSVAPAAPSSSYSSGGSAPAPAQSGYGGGNPFLRRKRKNRNRRIRHKRV